MLTIEAPAGVRTIMVSFRRGEYIIEALKEFLQQEGIDAALITSGIGSLDICELHTITHTDLPPTDRYFTLTGPIEVGSLLGSVAGGEPHIHVVVHDTANDVVYVGHLEEGSRCCYRVELGLLVLNEVKTQRVLDSDTGLVDIIPVEN